MMKRDGCLECAVQIIWAASTPAVISSPDREAYCTCIAIGLCMPKNYNYTSSSGINTGITAQAQINHVSRTASWVTQENAAGK